MKAITKPLSSEGQSFIIAVLNQTIVFISPFNRLTTRKRMHTEMCKIGFLKKGIK